MSEEDFKKSIEKTEKISKRVRNIGWIFVVLGFVGLLMGFFYWSYFDGKLNEVGDFVGGVSGSLWALAGLFFIYVAFLGQKIEIKYQQEELKLNREELKESRVIFKQQADIMLEQQLASTFFHLLDNHRKVVSSFKNREKERENITGYDALQSIRGSLKCYLNKYSSFLNSRNIFDSGITRSDPISEIKRYRDIEILYNEVSGIITFVTEKMIKDNKAFYLNILFNNLSNQEKFLLTAYNINCSDNHLKGLDFENYLRYNFKDFSKEESFLSFKNFFFQEYNPRQEIDEDFRIKIIDKNPHDYSEFNLYLIDENKKEIIHVKKIESIQQEIPIYNILLSITKEYYFEKIKGKEQKSNSRQEYKIILQGNNERHNFCMYDLYIINIAVDNGELKLYREHISNKFDNWIQDHFNNIENQES